MDAIYLEYCKRCQCFNFKLPKCLKLIWMENDSCTSRTAVRPFHGAPRPTCDNVRVNISAPAPRRDDVILICDSDTWHRQHTYSLTCCKQSLFGCCSVFFFFFLSPHVSIKTLLAAPAPRTPLSLAECWAKLKWEEQTGSFFFFFF